MSYEYLQKYDVPVPRQSTGNHYSTSNFSTMEGAYGTYSMHTTPTTPSLSYYSYSGAHAYSEAYVSYSSKTHASVVGSTGESYRNSDRYFPPSKYSTSHVYSKTYKRKLSDGRVDSKKEPAVVEVNSDGKLVMFMGRHESYPDELNSLIHPLICDLCNIKMNSTTSAKDHYESKVHDKNISSWLCRNYTEKGVSPPPIKRFFKQGPSGPDAFYCEPCDLKLTSLTHANQHYAGKKHRLVVAQKGKPSGAGYYNSEGKWVRTASKASYQYKDRRFGIGEQFKYGEAGALVETTNISNFKTSSSTTTTSIADTTTNESGMDTIKRPLNTISDPSLFCSICKVSVTSAVQMTMHLAGSKHSRKANPSGPNLIKFQPATDSHMGLTQTPKTDNVLLSVLKEEIKPDPTDLSMYRTPSGQYYCKSCNISISHLPALEQHLKGKRHMKRQVEERALAVLAAKKI